MIKANELRIGNYIYNPVQKINFKVDIVTIQNIINDNRNFTTKRESLYYRPIPLTEELLLKCGFNKEGKEYRRGSFFFFYQSVEENGSFTNIEFGKYRGTVRFILSFTVFSLHDLQNTYFYNSNKKELEINL